MRRSLVIETQTRGKPRYLSNTLRGNLAGAPPPTGDEQCGYRTNILRQFNILRGTTPKNLSAVSKKYVYKRNINEGMRFFRIWLFAAHQAMLTHLKSRQAPRHMPRESAPYI